MFVNRIKTIITVHDTYFDDWYNLYEQEKRFWTPSFCYTKANTKTVFTIWTLNQLTPQKFRHLAWTDIVLTALTLFLLRLFRSMGNISNGPSESSLAMRMALWSKWNLPGECPWQSDVANSMANKLQSQPSCLHLYIHKIFCSLVASRAAIWCFKQVIVCNRGCQIFWLLGAYNQL